MNGMLFKALLKNTKLTQLLVKNYFKKKGGGVNQSLFQLMVTVYNRKESLGIFITIPSPHPSRYFATLPPLAPAA